METRIFETLEPVRRRQRRVLILRSAALGLLVSSVAGVALGVWRWLGAGSISPYVTLSLLAAGPLAGGIVAAIRGRGWSHAASAVDARYHLKDRTVTAVDFVGRDQATTLHELQLADAEEHLLQVDARRVVPIRAPKSLPWALGASALALALLLWPRPTVQASVTAPLEQVVAAAEDAHENLEELEEAAEKQDDKELKRLVADLQQKIEEMKQPGVDVKEALAKLSEMQAAIVAQQALYNIGVVDAQMKGLGEALASSQALESAGSALQQEKYTKAADDLEKADPKFDRKEAKALKEKLKKSAQSMGAAGLGELSESTDQLAESVGDMRADGSALKKLGKLAREHGRRKQINNLLKSQCKGLAECKANCQKNSTAVVHKRIKSNRPATTWGKSISGNVDGEKTTLGADRQKDVIKGQMGEGPSETETTHSPEGRQTATREYAARYQKYRRMTEAALNNEPIPLGHRQTIRRYFELIRPLGEESQPADAKPAAGPVH
jgi:hypothetical protein